MKSNAPEKADGTDQRRLRPTAPVRDLSEFVGFLEEIEELLGPIVKKREIGVDERCLL